MTFHVNCLPTDNSHEMSNLIWFLEARTKTEHVVCWKILVGLLKGYFLSPQLITYFDIAFVTGQFSFCVSYKLIDLPLFSLYTLLQEL